ncbi:hypothetical protein I2I11_16195 [Pontibacter sp. 172403-2]|uniref:hypothetical protein n=1 Tax=Pontibacter rufus TaxID=2791028 RepID=UPI0018B015A9|nr:hypothetical protein [Pontibacter sp. 172403-2]MBF9254844.1 hypothetical protein [Pontibacter sp. 172403-2]
MKIYLRLTLLISFSMFSCIGYGQNKLNSVVSDTLLTKEWSNITRGYELRSEILGELQEHLSKKEPYKKLSDEIHSQITSMDKEWVPLNPLSERERIVAEQDSLTSQIEKWLTVDLANDTSLIRDEEYDRITLMIEGINNRIYIEKALYNKEAEKRQHRDLILEGVKSITIPQVKF